MTDRELIIRVFLRRDLFFFIFEWQLELMVAIQFTHLMLHHISNVIILQYQVMAFYGFIQSPGSETFNLFYLQQPYQFTFRNYQRTFIPEYSPPSFGINEDYYFFPNQTTPEPLIPQQSLQDHTVIASEVNQIKYVSDKNVYKYAKKNAESNLINQLFSYLSIPAKSQAIVASILDFSKKKTAKYYAIIKVLKKRNSKYINRVYIKELIEMKQGHGINNVFSQINPRESLQRDEFKKVLRVLIRYYFRNISINTILTSKKLDNFSKKEHLQRRREVCNYLNCHIRSQQRTIKD